MPDGSTIHQPDRRTYIGGSDAAAILGLSPWRTPLDLWNQKVAETPEPAPDASRARVLERGKRLEPYVLDMLRAETGIVIERRNERYTDFTHPFMQAEVDAETTDGENVEIKTALYGGAEWGAPDSDEIPVHYAAQVMHGLMVTGRKLCIVGVLIGVDDFRVYRVHRDEDTILAMRAKERYFWREHVEKRIAPPATTGDDVLRFLRPDDTLALDATHDACLLGLVNDVRDARAARKHAESVADQAEDALKLAMGEATQVRVGRETIATFKGGTRSAFSKDDFCADPARAALYEQFKRTATTRTLRVK